VHDQFRVDVRSSVYWFYPVFGFGKQGDKRGEEVINRIKLASVVLCFCVGALSTNFICTESCCVDKSRMMAAPDKHMPDYKEGDELKKGYNLALFGTQWCTPCKRLKAEMPSLAPKLKAAGVDRMFYVDGDKWKAFRQTQSIALYPTFVLYYDGVEVTRVYGLDPKAYLPYIEKAIKRHKGSK
jgi:thiol-disulfide isomerase/thioredoxin